MLQTLLVVAIVGACAVHALWRLLPTAAQSRVAGWLLRLPLPGQMAQALRGRAKRTTECGCAGCDRAQTSVEPVNEQPVRWLTRRRG